MRLLLRLQVVKRRRGRRQPQRNRQGAGQLQRQQHLGKQ